MHEDRDTPMMTQYKRVRDSHPGYLVLFRVGDFYETFGEEASLLSKELDIVLTSRQSDAEGRIPMAGIPHHALETYLSRLVRKGHRVVICDQVEQAGQGKGLLERAVTRVVTPGTVLEDTLLPSGTSNYLAAWSGSGDEGYAVALVDISTGETLLQDFPKTTILSAAGDIATLSPTEVVVSSSHKGMQEEVEAAWKATLEGVRVVIGPEPLPADRLPDEWQEVAHSSSRVGDVLGTAAAYIEKCEPRIFTHLSAPRWRDMESAMHLDLTTLRHLEVTEAMNPGSGKTKTLLDVINVAESPAGRRVIESWLRAPLANPQEIDRRSAAVEFFTEPKEGTSLLRSRIRRVSDLSRLTARIRTRRATPRDVLAIGHSLGAISEVVSGLTGGTRGTPPPFLASILARLDPHTELAMHIAAAVVEDPPNDAHDGGVLRPEAFPRLMELREKQRSAERSIVELERKEASATGIKSLKIGYNQVFGYYFEVTKPHAAKVPQDRWRRKQTLSSSERYTSPELNDLESVLLSVREESSSVERGLWEELISEIDAKVESLRITGDALGELDAITSLAEVARQKHWVRAKVNMGKVIRIREGRHPMLEETLGRGYVPNDTDLDCEDTRLVLLTGPNMAGKSTYMRQVGLIVLLAQCGSFVPAKYAEIGVVDYLATRMGFTDEIGRGKSSFMVEMSEVAQIINRSGKRSLVLLDEVGRGTSTSDGMSLAWAIVKYFHDTVKARTIVATHYHELAQLVASLPGVKNAHLAVKEEEGRITFLRTLLPGATNKSYGIHVAELAGLPPQVIKEAAKELKETEERTSRSEDSRPKRSKTSARYTQALLVQDSLGEEERKVIDTIRSLNVDGMTPLEALNAIHKLAGELKGKGTL